MHDMLTRVYEDMPVYDREGNKIGSVEDIQFGDEDPHRPGPETATAQGYEMKERDLIDNLAEAFGPPDRFPEAIRARLLRYGYIKIDTGLLSSDVYASADQLTEVNHERVVLNVTKDELFSL